MKRHTRLNRLSPEDVWEELDAIDHELALAELRRDQGALRRLQARRRKLMQKHAEHVQPEFDLVGAMDKAYAGAR